MRLEFSDKGDNPTIPIAERVPLEVQARDTAGTADFDLE